MATEAGSKFYAGGKPDPVLVQTATSYVALPRESQIEVTDTSAPRTVTLPALSAVEPGSRVTVKDGSGGADTHNITVAAAGSDAIDGGTSVAITSAYGTAAFYSAGSAWRAVSAPASLSTLQSRTATVAYTDLTDAVSGEAQAVNVGAVLPAGAVVVGHEVALTTQFTGGSISACKLSLGGTDTVAICNQFDVKGSTAGGKKYSPGYEHGTIHGDHCTGALGGEQLVATFAPTGDSLSNLVAGAATITVWFLAG